MSHLRVMLAGMGYRGKVSEQERARRLRAEGWTMPDIAPELGVARSSVSLWTRDVDFVPRRGRRTGGPSRGQHPQHLARVAEVTHLLGEGRSRIGNLGEQEFLVAGTALYAGEGDKTDRAVGFANTDARMITFFCAWLRHFFEIDERRLHLRLYLHQGLDLELANLFWSRSTGIPIAQFWQPYRAIPDRSLRRSKHPMGCPKVVYPCASTHRAVMGLVHALLASEARSGVAQSAAQLPVKETVVGSSPTPGASSIDPALEPEGP